MDSIIHKMEWKELPGNYDDFQAEIYHVKDTVTVLKSFLDEYIQHEVTFEVLKKYLKSSKVQYKNGLTHLYTKHSKVFENLDSLKQPGTDSFVLLLANNLMLSLQSRVKQTDIYTEKLVTDSQFKQGLS